MEHAYDSEFYCWCGACRRGLHRPGWLSVWGTGTAPATAFSETPIVATDVVVKANGLSCPLCASNIDSTLKKIPGVASVSIDLEKGEIRIGLTGGVRPSKARLAKAVKDAGFTVVSVN